MAKILVVSQYFWPEDFRINDLCQILIENHHSVTVLTGQPNYPSGQNPAGYKWWSFKKESHNNIEIYRVPLYPRKNGKSIHLVLNYLSFLFFSLLMIPVISTRKKFDFVFGWGTSPIFQSLAGSLIAKIQVIPFKIWVLDLWPDSLIATNTIKNKPTLKFISFLVLLFYKSCDDIFCLSKSFIEHIANQGVPRKKLHYFPNWAEDTYANLQNSELINKNLQFESTIKNKKLITYAGNLGEAQDLETLIQAINLNKTNQNIHFLFLGDGRQKEWLISKIDELNLSHIVTYLGYFPQKDMPYFFKLSLAMLLTLKAEDIFKKTIPGRMMSFMAAAKPVIGAIEGESQDIIIQSKSGLCVNSGNPQELAKIINDFSTLNDEEISTMSKNSLQYFHDNFSRSKVYDRFIVPKMSN